MCHAETVSETARGIRLMTMNVLAPSYADGSSRRVVLAEELQRLGPDVLALQEVTREDAEVLESSGWHVLPHPRWSAEGVGAVLAARRPFGRTVSDTLEVTERTVHTEAESSPPSFRSRNPWAPSCWCTTNRAGPMAGSTSGNCRHWPWLASRSGPQPKVRRSTPCCWGTSMRLRRQAACDSSKGCSRWKAWASAVKTPGRPCIPASKARLSAPATPSSGKVTCPKRRTAASTTSCSAAAPDHPPGRWSGTGQ
ncbi:endonuclease/exonuclease/phosphatase family protein [Streptomyces sp. NPDC056296]|uniref:endonuclease/exonuclease/phosphatase family protein n=1 Tax=Streptomyces sp. NPDC056296 TaxID=3345775 RepID=UPI0035DEC9AA